MNAGAALGLAVRSLRRHRVRTSLAMLGIVIGIAAVICMVALGQGASGAVQAQMDAMGRNLLKAEFPLTIHTRTRARSERLLAEGARWTDSPAELAAEVDVIISMVSDSPDVEAVYLGSSGVCESIRPGSLVVTSCSTHPLPSGSLNVAYEA